MSEVDLESLLDDPERKVDEIGEYRFGDRVELTEDIELSFEGAQGRLLLERVGGEEYGNVREAIFFVEDGMDMPMEVYSGQFRVLV